MAASADASGKRMKIINRVFFSNELQAIKNGYRPCAHCMGNKYLLWRQIINN
jgi:methylphosphotriester-DNA--protein-cysteine methyltransferase